MYKILNTDGNKLTYLVEAAAYFVCGLIYLFFFNHAIHASLVVFCAFLLLSLFFLPAVL